MSPSAKVAWGHECCEVVGTVDELDALLDRLDDEACRTGRPQDVQVTIPGDAGTLGLVVGHGRSVLNHVPPDGNPPYTSSVGNADEDRPFTFYVADDHHSESRWRHTIPAAEAREAARAFFLTGRLDERVRWDEV